MQNAIIIHGMPSKEEYYSERYPSASNFQWLPWLQKQLLIKDIEAVTPEMPHAYLPDYEIWKKEFERYDILEDTILVGHSCGGGFLVRWLSEHKDAKVGKVILVAPWIDPDHSHQNGFFDFTIDPDLAKRAKELVVFNSTDDDAEIQKSVSEIREKVVGVKYVEFENQGHFIGDEFVKNGFPKLLEECLK